MTREEAVKIFNTVLLLGKCDCPKEEIEECLKMAIKALEQEPKTGHWIDIMVGDMPAQACDRCNTFYPLAYTGGGHNYCPNCGARMIESQESEDKE